MALKWHREPMAAAAMRAVPRAASVRRAGYADAVMWVTVAVVFAAYTALSVS